ncbi:MAG: VOC family protein [Chloroflexota bacterium]
MTLPILAVKNYDASLKFYTEKLGFTSTLTMQGREGENTFGFVEHGEGVRLGLSQDSSDLTGRGNGVILMLYPTDAEIDELYNQVKSAGVKITEELKTEVWGDRLFSVKDLDGYYLTFCKTVASMPSVEEIQAAMNSQP